VVFRYFLARGNRVENFPPWCSPRECRNLVLLRPNDSPPRTCATIQRRGGRGGSLAPPVAVRLKSDQMTVSHFPPHPHTRFFRHPYFSVTVPWNVITALDSTPPRMLIDTPAMVSVQVCDSFAPLRSKTLSKIRRRGRKLSAPSTTGRDPTVPSPLVGVRGHRLMADNSGLRAALERANEATAEFSADPPDPWPPFLGLTKLSAWQKYPLRQKPFSSGTQFVPAFRRIREPMPVLNARHGARSESRRKDALHRP